MTEMGVPQHVQEEVLATPSDKGLLLDEKTIKTYFWLDLPYRHEWLKNKCPQLSSSEKQQLSIYSNRLRRSRNASTADLTKQEWADLDALQKKEDKERKCEIAIIQRGQIEAYEKYFNVKANDFANQNFSKWSEATKYLGKHFYDLMSEEKFDEDKDALSDVISSLRRDATATAPSVLLFDTQSKPRVVASINLLSTPNPSSEYIQRLVKCLEDAWGKPSGGNEASEWRWTAKEFFAVLKKETFAEGPIIDLKIEARRQ